MIECPELAAFESGTLSVELARHLDDCDACRFVAELAAERDGDDACLRFEALLAARAEGALGAAGAALLARHLSTCRDCRAVADTLAPTADAAGDLLALPEVDPANYELGLEVARGGMGRILAARDRRIGRPVAVKELLGRTPALAARFEREARVTARLQHPGIVAIYEIGRWPNGTPFYAMRLVDGRTLREAIDAASTLAARLALMPAVIAATDAVAFAHAQRIIHRDLTPSNILVGAYGETVVIDWGLARDLSADELKVDGGDGAGDREGASTSSRLTGLGSVIGTAAYMPPEQAHAISVDERADVYALGAIIYHLLAGRPPYEQAATDKQLAAVRTGPPPPLRARAPSVPRDLASIVDKAMARDLDARYPSARELREELQRWSAGRRVAAHAYTRGERLGRFLARHRAPLAVLAIAALGLAILGFVSVRRIIDSQANAETTTRALLEERGRTEALAGHSLKALAYLGAARDGDQPSPALELLLASALRELDDVEATLDCGADVQYSALSPDGVHVAAACGDLGRVWRLDDHGLVHAFGPIAGAFMHVAYSPDGTSVTFIGKDGVARAYDAATGALRLELVHGKGVALNRALWTPAGDRLITTGDDGRAVIWDTATGTPLHTITAGYLGFAGVYGLLTPDGHTLVTATLGGVGRGWDVETGVERGSIDHGAQMIGGDLSPDGTLAATCGADRRARVWDLATLAPRATFTGHAQAVWRCTFSADGRRLLTTGQDGTAKVWDLASGVLVTSVDAGDFIWRGELSRDGTLLVTNTLEGWAQVWDARTGALLASHGSAGLASHFSADGTRLVMERGDGKLTLWRRPAGPRRATLSPPAGAVVRAASADGRRAVLARGGALELWDVGARRPLAHAAIATPFALSADGRRLAARAPTGVLVLDVDSGNTVATLPVVDARELALDHAGDRLLATGGGAPQVLAVDGDGPPVTLTGATDAMLSGDGRRALAWSDGARPVVWSLDVDAPPVTIARTEGRLGPVGFSADDRRVAIIVHAESVAPTLGIWDTADGALLARVPAVPERVHFDPRGRMITAVGADGVVRTLRTDDGVLVSAFAGERVTGAQIDADGALLVATDRGDGAVSVLDAVDGRVVAQWPIQQATAIPSEQSFTLEHNAAWWTPEGGAIVATDGDVTVWEAQRLPADTARIDHALATLPWRVVDGQLRERRARIRGRVTRDGAPIAGATVAVTYREIPRRATRTYWSAASSRQRIATAVTGADGSYEIRDLPAGDYRLLATSARDGCASAAVERTMAELDQAVDVALTQCGAGATAPPPPPP